MKVLHYKTNFLNSSETFINRLIRNHNSFEPIAMCIRKRKFTDHLPVFQQPQSGLFNFINTICFHLNLSLPFYEDVIHDQSPDIIHAHFGYDGWRMYQVAKKTNTPLVVSFYGSDVSRLPKEFDWKRRYRNLARNAQKFIAASNYMKSQLIDLGFPEEDIEVIRFGIDLDKFPFKKRFNPSHRLMMVGRMVEKKGFRYALQALKMLTEQHNRNIYIDFYGNGPLKKDLQKEAEDLGIHQYVQFMGYVSNSEVRNELQKHSILLAPSVTAEDGDKEGLPNTILEAMASGVPVIATDHAAIPEAVQRNKTGLLVPERDPEAIASALVTLLDEEIDADQIRRNARNLIEEKYSVERLVNTTERLYSQIIKRHEK